MKKYLCSCNLGSPGLFLSCALIALAAVPRARAQEYVSAWWSTNGTGEWVDDSNWSSFPETPELPDPGYPASNWVALVFCGEAQISTTVVSVAKLDISAGGTVRVADGKALTCLGSLNGAEPEEDYSGNLVLADGQANILNTSTGTVNALTVVVGAEGNGYFALGSYWDATNGFPSDFGKLANISVSVQQGGLRVQANSIAMEQGCLISNAAQEITFRGDWLNPDGTTTLHTRGSGPNGISIGGDFSFHGCALKSVINADGIDLIDVGGDAILTDVTLTIGAVESLQNVSNAYDLVRVPTARSILTNGMTLSSDIAGGVVCSAIIEENRNGYDYLVISPVNVTPYTVITNPTARVIAPSGSSVTIDATASDSDGAVSKVEFYADSTKLGEDTSPPFSYLWTNVLGGLYELKVVATDDKGDIGESPVVTLGVQGLNAEGRNVFVAGDVIITYDPECVQE